MKKIVNILIAALLAVAGLQAASTHHLVVSSNYVELLQSLDAVVPLYGYSPYPLLY